MSLSGKNRLTTDRSLSNDSFWPDVTLGELTENYRVPVEYADEVISTALKLAILDVNQQCGVAKNEIENQGYTSLENYALANSNAIDDEEGLLIIYRHAVCCHAKAFLLKQQHTLQRLPTTGNAAQDALQSEDFWYTRAESGIARLLAEVLKTDYNDPAFLRVCLI